MSERRPRFADVVGEEEAARFAAEEQDAERRAQRRRKMPPGDELRYCRNALADARAECDALAATADRLRVRLHAVHDLWREWQYGEYSATEVEPGLAYCADQLAKVLAPSDPATDTGGEGHG